MQFEVGKKYKYGDDMRVFTCHGVYKSFGWFASDIGGAPFEGYSHVEAWKEYIPPKKCYCSVWMTQHNNYVWTYSDTNTDNYKKRKEYYLAEKYRMLGESVFEYDIPAPTVGS